MVEWLVGRCGQYPEGISFGKFLGKFFGKVLGKFFGIYFGIYFQLFLGQRRYLPPSLSVVSVGVAGVGLRVAADTERRVPRWLPDSACVAWRPRGTSWSVLPSCCAASTRWCCQVPLGWFLHRSAESPAGDGCGQVHDAGGGDGAWELREAARGLGGSQRAAAATEPRGVRASAAGDGLSAGEAKEEEAAINGDVYSFVAEMVGPERV